MFVGLAILLSYALTISPSFFSINLTIEFITLSAAFLLPTNIKLSSAYLTN